MFCHGGGRGCGPLHDLTPTGREETHKATNSRTQNDQVRLERKINEK